MCARYITFDHRDDGIFFGIAPYIRHPETDMEIRPTDSAPVFVKDADTVCPRQMRWGLPMQRAGVIFNARAETMDEKKLFRDAYHTRRCVVPAFGFYEWDKESGKKYFFRQSDEGILYMAGLYQKNREDERFVVITTQAFGAVAEIHPRMPMLLNPCQAMSWLESLEGAQRLRFADFSQLRLEPVLA